MGEFNNDTMANTAAADRLTAARGSSMMLHSEPFVTNKDSEAHPDLSTRDEETPPRPAGLLEKHAVPLVFTLFVVMRALDRVFNKRVSDRMKNYQLMYVNVLWPVGIQIVTVGLIVCYIMYRRVVDHDMRYDWRFLLPGSTMASGYGAVAMWRLGIFSIFDQINASLTSLPAPFIDITSQNIMQNMVIVWTLLISIVYLGTRYHQVHYIGSVLVVLSGLAAISVEIQSGKGLGEYKTASGQTEQSNPGWYLIFLLGTIPAGMSNCYKQKTLQSFNLEVMYATLWSGWFQILWGVLFFPLNWIPLPNLQTEAPEDTLDYFQRGWQCFIGNNPDGDLSATNAVEMSVCQSPGGSAATWFLVYLVFNLSFNVLFLWLTKRMSATWAAIATVLCQDLSSLFSMSKLLMGDEAQAVTYEQYVGLTIAAVAMWAYNIESEVPPEADQVNDGLTSKPLPTQHVSSLLSPSFSSGRVVLGVPEDGSFYSSTFEKNSRRTFG